MRHFKYLFFVIILITQFARADAISDSFGTYSWTHEKLKGQTFKSAQQACSAYIPTLKLAYLGHNPTYVTVNKLNYKEYQCVIRIHADMDHGSKVTFQTPSSDVCPSATESKFKVPVNTGVRWCSQNCSFRLVSCVNVEFDSGGDPDGGDHTTMTCSGISTGSLCGSSTVTSPTGKPSPDTGGNPPITSGGANQNNDGSSNPTNSANTTGNSTTTYDETNNTWNTTTTTSTSIDTSSLENNITNNTDKVINKFKCLVTGDCPKDGGDGDGDGELPDKPFGDGVVPTEQLTQNSLNTNIFASNAQCPNDSTLNLPIGSRTFSYTFSFSLWCYWLSILGYFILIGAYCYGAYIVVSKS